MSIPLLDSGKGLFEILGKFAHTLNVLNTARGITVAGEALDAVNQYKLKTDTTLDFDRAVQSFANGEQSWRQGGDGFASIIASTCRNLLAEFVKSDNPNIGNSLTDQLKYLIADMLDQEYYVSSTEGGGGDPGLNYDTYIGTRDLKTLHAWIVDESAGESLSQLVSNDLMKFEVVSSAPSGSTLRVTGSRAARNNLSEDFTTAGAGFNTLLPCLTPASSLLQNADFSGEWYSLGGGKYAPEGWTITGGTDFSKTAVPVLTATITGTPTTGQFTLKLHSPNIGEQPGGNYVGTASIAFDATAEDVEAAVRAVPGYDLATVARTGSAPNYVYTITCTGLAGDPDAPGAYDAFDTGGVTGGKTTSGDDNSIDGPTLIIGNASVTTHSIEQSVELTPGEVYFVGVRAITAGNGGYTISLLDAIGGSALPGNSSRSTSVFGGFGGAGLPGLIGFFYRIPRDVTGPVAVKLSSNTPSSSWWFGDIIVAPATELYPGGPYVAAVHGKNPPAVGDPWSDSGVGENDFTGAWLLAFDQMFDLRGKRLMLPLSGGTLINDSLIG